MIIEETEKISDSVKKIGKRTTVKELSGSWNFKLGRKNVLRLDEWLFNRYDPKHIDMADFGSATNVVGLGPISKKVTTTYPADFCYTTVVDTYAYDGELYILKECSAVEGKWEIYVNGILVDNWTRMKEYDCMNEAADLRPYLIKSDNRLYRKGELTICVKITADNAQCGLHHPIYLLGDFKVRLNNAESVGAELLPKDDVITMYNGSWVDQGFPHYSGHASYSQEFSMDNILDDCRYYINAEAFGGAVSVSINGCDPATAIAEPFVVDVTDMIREGINHITIETANTAENFFYDLRVPAGISKPVIIIEEKLD